MIITDINEFMNEPLKNILNDNDLISNNNLKFLGLLIKQYEAREVELNNTNKDLKQSLSNL